jgi:hypothetical protein
MIRDGGSISGEGACYDEAAMALRDGSSWRKSLLNGF